VKNADQVRLAVSAAGASTSTDTSPYPPAAITPTHGPEDVQAVMGSGLVAHESVPASSGHSPASTHVPSKIEVAPVVACGAQVRLTGAAPLEQDSCWLEQLDAVQSPLPVPDASSTQARASQTSIMIRTSLVFAATFTTLAAMAPPSAVVSSVPASRMRPAQAAVASVVKVAAKTRLVRIMMEVWEARAPVVTE
jgi:hypothetical protein